MAGSRRRGIPKQASASAIELRVPDPLIRLLFKTGWSRILRVGDIRQGERLSECDRG